MYLAEIKAEALARGIRITHAAADRITQGGRLPLSARDYVTTSGVTLELESGDFVNAPFDESMWPDARLILDFDGRFVLRAGTKDMEARPWPQPSYLQETTSSGAPVRRIAMTHCDRVRLSPIDGCANTCSFCDLPRSHAYTLRSLDDILEAMELALDDEALPARHLLISGGTPRSGDGAALDEIYRQVTRACPVPVDIMLCAREDASILRDLHDWGVHGLSINMELYSQEAGHKYTPEKLAGSTPGFLSFIEEAVRVFGAGNGRIRSLLLVGLSPIEATLEGVEALASRGCDPVLSPFRPSAKTPLRDHPAPDTATLVTVYQRSLEIVRRHGVQLGPRCVPCQNNTMTVADPEAKPPA